VGPVAGALARIGAILHRGVQDRDVPWLSAAADLCAHLDALPTAGERDAEHQRIIGHGVFAWEPVFLRADALRTEVPAAEAWAERAGLPTAEAGSLGRQLEIHAALRDPAFTAAHVGRWAVPALLAIRTQDSPLYAALADTALELGGHTLVAPPELPEVPAILDDPKTGLRRIAEHVLIPALSGWFLSRDDLRQLATAVALPCGFGTRSQMLTALLAAGAEHGALSAVTGAMVERAAGLRGRMDELGATAWSERLAGTEALLTRIGAAADPGADPETPSPG